MEGAAEMCTNIGGERSNMVWVLREGLDIWRRVRNLQHINGSEDIQSEA